MHSPIAKSTSLTWALFPGSRALFLFHDELVRLFRVGSTDLAEPPFSHLSNRHDKGRHWIVIRIRQDMRQSPWTPNLLFRCISLKPEMHFRRSQGRCLDRRPKWATSWPQFIPPLNTFATHSFSEFPFSTILCVIFKDLFAFAAFKTTTQGKHT